MSEATKRCGDLTRSVKDGEPRATWISQNLPLTFLVPISVWMALDQGNARITAVAWLIGAITFNLLWLPNLRRNQHPPAGQSQSIAAATSAIGVYLVPEVGLLLTSFISMGVTLCLFASLRRHATFQFACVIAASYFTFQAEAITLRSWVLFAVWILPMAFAAVSFASADLGHRNGLLDDALNASGSTVWGVGSDGTIRSSIGAGIVGLGVGSRLVEAMHPQDRRPRCPEPGTTFEYRVSDPAGGWRSLRESVEATSTSTNEHRSNVSDITAEKAASELMRYQADHDQLTGQPNRASHIRESHAWAESATGSLILVDLDKFKDVNDTLGHSTGDRVLQGAGERLAATYGLAHLARLGGDEFACLVHGDRIQAQAIADALVAAANEPYPIDSMLVHAGACAGIARFEPGTDSDETRRQAGVALQEAKKTGGLAIHYGPDIDRESARRKALAARLPIALAQREFVMYHQPKIDLATRQIVGFEALVRWQHPHEGLLMPDAFLDLVSVGGLHRELYQLVLARALEDRVAMGAGRGHLTVAVNVHAANLRESDFVERTLAALDKHGLTPRDLVLELLEEDIIGEDRAVAETLVALDQAGIQLSIDDFGSGFSALSYLNRLPVAEIKLDRSLVSQVAESERGRAVVELVLGLATRLDLRVVAEGIEDSITLEYFADQGCQHGQGYFIDKPKPAEHWIAQGDPSPATSAASNVPVGVGSS